MQKVIALFMACISMLCMGCTPEPSWKVPEDRFVLLDAYDDPDGLCYDFSRKEIKQIDSENMRIQVDGFVTVHVDISDWKIEYLADTAYFLYYCYEPPHNGNLFDDGYAFVVTLEFVNTQDHKPYTKPIPKTVTFTATFCYVGESEERTETHTLDLTKLWDGR